MGFLKVNRRFLEHFWRNSGKIFRPFCGIFVARPITQQTKPKTPAKSHDLY